MSAKPVVHLQDVKRAKSRAERATLDLLETIVGAVDAGASQADVGRAAGLSRGRVHQIVKAAKGSDGND